MMADDEKLTEENINEEVETFMFEGHDTTSSGMAWSLWFLGHNPECQEKVYQEINDVLDGDVERDITTDDLTQMKYLEMCIKEAMRICPPVPLFARELQSDVKIGRHTLPAGVTVMVIPLMIQRDPTQYEKINDFYPEHFLPEVAAKRNPYAYVPFSAGARNCIGQKFALLEEKIVLANLLRRFRVESMEPVLSRIMRPLPEVITRPINGFPMRFYERT